MWNEEGADGFTLTDEEVSKIRDYLTRKEKALLHRLLLSAVLLVTLILIFIEQVMNGFELDYRAAMYVTIWMMGRFGVDWVIPLPDSPEMDSLLSRFKQGG